MAWLWKQGRPTLLAIVGAGVLNLGARADHGPAPLCDNGNDGLRLWVIGRTEDGCGVHSGQQEDDSCCDA